MLTKGLDEFVTRDLVWMLIFEKERLNLLTAEQPVPHKSSMAFCFSIVLSCTAIVLCACACIKIDVNILYLIAGKTTCGTVY